MVWPIVCTKVQWNYSWNIYIFIAISLVSIDTSTLTLFRKGFFWRTYALFVNLKDKAFSCVKTNTYSSYFAKLAERTLREKCPNMKFFLVRIFPLSDWIRRDTPYLFVFSPNAGKYGPKKTLSFDTFHVVGASINLLSVSLSTFFKHLYSWICENWIELNRLCKHMGNVRCSQAFLSINSCTELLKTQLFSEIIR